MRNAFIFAVALCISVIVVSTIRTFTIIYFNDPPPVFMINNLDEQVACAQRAGFVFKKPILRVMRKPVVLDDSSGVPYFPSGIAHMNYNIILLANYASYETMAHELGHIIDWQTRRKGHPFFRGKEKMGSQEFANAIMEVILAECLPK